MPRPVKAVSRNYYMVEDQVKSQEEIDLEIISSGEDFYIELPAKGYLICHHGRYLYKGPNLEEEDVLTRDEAILVYKEYISQL